MPEQRQYTVEADIVVNGGLPLTIRAYVFEGSINDYSVLQIGRKRCKRSPRFVAKYDDEIMEKMSEIIG